MNNPATGASFQSGKLLPWLAFVFLLMLVSTATAAGDTPAVDSQDKAGDPTGLSIQEPYNLDIVQPNVLGGHTHPAGESMFGYRYMHMNMSGLYDGSREIS